MKARVQSYLNIRSGLPEILANNNPGYYSPNDEVEIVETVVGDEYKGNDVWYKLKDGGFIWSGGVQVMAAASFISDFWFKKLKIEEVWTTYRERGENATALILDTGINENIAEIRDAIAKPLKNFDSTSADMSSNDEDSHGTHCFSLIGARASHQFIGAAPASRIYVGKISESKSLQNWQTLKQGLKEFLKDEYSVDVISISQALPDPDPELERILQQHAQRNTIIVASIGNNYASGPRDFKRYPGCFEVCISVGSCANNQTPSAISMNHRETCVFCYGENIMGYKKTNTPEPLTGTSQATAIVAAICCLIVSFLKKNQIKYTPASIKGLLTKNSSPLMNYPDLHLINPMLIFSSLQKIKANGIKNL